MRPSCTHRAALCGCGEFPGTLGGVSEFVRGASKHKHKQKVLFFFLPSPKMSGTNPSIGVVALVSSHSLLSWVQLFSDAGLAGRPGVFQPLPAIVCHLRISQALPARKEGRRAVSDLWVCGWLTPGTPRVPSHRGSWKRTSEHLNPPLSSSDPRCHQIAAGGMKQHVVWGSWCMCALTSVKSR